MPIKNYYTKLKTYQITLLDSGSDATQDYIYTFLVSNGNTKKQANDYISFLNSTGNSVFYGEYVNNSNYNVVIYFEKNEDSK